MARQILDIGGNANDGTGDTLRAAMDKINDNFVELYDVSVDNFITITQNNITATRSNDNINLIPAGTGTVAITNLTIDNNINLTDNNISVTQTNSDLVLRSSGTGDLVFDTVSIHDNTISTNASNADLELSANGTGTVQLLKNTTASADLAVTGTLTVSGTATLSTSLTLASGATVTGIDNGALGSSATLLATQGAIKTYIDAQVTAQDLDFATDDSTLLSIDLDSESLQFSGGTGITTAGSGNTVTIAIDSTVATLTGSQTLTNKTLTAPTINTPTFGGTSTVTGSLAIDYVTIADNTISTNASNADLQLSGSGTGTVVLNSLRFPSSDGTGNQVLITDGSGNLGWATVATGSFTHITNADGTVSLTGSSAGVVDSFTASTYRSAKYSVSMWDSTNSRAGIQDFYVTHDGSSAYITATGITSTGADMATFTADIDSGNVRVLATLASGDGTVFKFNKILINV
jgi:hypothetical protein